MKTKEKGKEEKKQGIIFLSHIFCVFSDHFLPLNYYYYCFVYFIIIVSFEFYTIYKALFYFHFYICMPFTFEYFTKPDTIAVVFLCAKQFFVWRHISFM